MSLRWMLGAGVVAVVGHAACGYPEFEYVDEDGSGGAGASTSSPTTSGGGAPGGMGGAPGCNLGEVGACGDGMKCTVVDLNTGAVDCNGAGPRGPWSRCEDDLECVDGTFCDPQLRTCKPICQSGNDCATGAQCYPGAKSGGGDIPGLKLCTSHCHPEMGTPCDSANGPVTCYYDVTRAEFDCAATINLPELAPCDTATDCTTGFACIGPTGSSDCRQWCTPINSSCPFILEFCNALNPSVTYGGSEYGVCG